VFVSYATALAAVAILISIWAPEVIGIVAGPRFIEAGGILPWLAAAGAASGSYALLILAAGLGDRTRAVAWTAAVGAGVQVASAVVLAPRFGLTAAGIAVLAGQLTPLILLHRAVAPSIPGLGLALAALLGGAVLSIGAIALHGLEASLLLRSTLAISIGLVGGVGAYRSIRLPGNAGQGHEATR
jgi:O-antigen/teichoic acid export membrane protein